MIEDCVCIWLWGPHRDGNVQNPCSCGHIFGSHKENSLWGGERAISDRVQLLRLAKAFNFFLMCAVLSVSPSLSKSITFSKMESGGHSNLLRGHGPQMPPLAPALLLLEKLHFYENIVAEYSVAT